MWTFGRKIALGFALSLLTLLAVGTLAYRSIQALTENSYEVTRIYTTLGRLGQMLSLMKDAETGQRGFVITGADSYLEPYHAAKKGLVPLMKDLHAAAAGDTILSARLARADAFINQKMDDMEGTIEARRTQGAEAAAQRVQGGRGKQVMDDLRTVTSEMEQRQRSILAERAADVEKTAGNARLAIIAGTLLCLAVVTVAGYLIVRSLTEEIGAAVNHVRQSSTELQAAATQQSAAARESSTAMTEISTTVSELLATSKQIAESAQRVAATADQTGAAARAGDGTVQRSDDAIMGIRRQVDQIVSHMLDLGKKSQQIGAVLDIVTELAEQTNILAINATIEASGAGEAGKRFGVVADEIRKLADRVGGSAKEIRLLIEDVRSAVNTTVMATETGSKAVDVGSRLFAEVAQSFKQISDLIGYTMEAAREIELSTKQQASAVEQVKIAIASTAQATKETEVSSGQTFQTATQLTSLSNDLLKLVQPKAAR